MSDFQQRNLYQRSGGSGSPIKKSIQSSSQYDVRTPSYVETRKEMDEELRGHWIGPMPVPEFLEAFLPLQEGERRAPKKPRLFDKLPRRVRQEKSLYDPLMKCVNSSRPKLMPNFKLVNTSDHSDVDSPVGKKNKPDLSLYWNRVNTQAKRHQTEEQELPWELKRDKTWDICRDPPLEPESDLEQNSENDVQDDGEDEDAGGEADWLVNQAEEDNLEPLDHAEEDDVDEEESTPGRADLGQPFEKPTQKARDCRGQIAAYATIMNSRQHRLHSFTVFICHPYVRLLRFDRAGIVVSRRFNIFDQGQYLVDFLWRFSHALDAARGRDETVRYAGTSDVKLAKRLLEKYSPEQSRPVVVFTVPHEGQDREFLGWGSISDAHSLIGRATRAYPVVDRQTEKLYFLKDTWRASELLPEAEILRELNSKAVNHVPRLICGGDVKAHSTVTHIYAKDGPTTAAADRQPIIQRIHHRFVEDCIGVHLDKFECTKDLVVAILHALQAHKDAYEKCSILHRDISGKNILLVWCSETKKWKGILNDWDLAKRIDDANPRNHHRTGTWQFISTLLCMNPTKPHSLQDDLESVVLVLLYHVIRYTRHNADRDASYILDRVFGAYDRHEDHTVTGGDYKMNLFTRQSYIGLQFAVTDNRPLTRCVRQAIAAVGRWLLYHDQEAKTTEPDWDLPKTNILFEDAYLNDHRRLMDICKEVLESPDWPLGDPPVDNYHRAGQAVIGKVTQKLEPTTGNKQKSLGAGDSGSGVGARSSQGSQGKRARELADPAGQSKKKRK